MLHGVTALMGGNRSGGDTIAIINRLTQVHRLVSGIVMVRQMSGCRNHLYIIDTIVMQHLLSDIFSCHAIRHRDFRILLKLALKAG